MRTTVYGGVGAVVMTLLLTAGSVAARLPGGSTTVPQQSVVAGELDRSATNVTARGGIPGPQQMVEEQPVPADQPFPEVALPSQAARFVTAPIPASPSVDVLKLSIPAPVVVPSAPAVAAQPSLPPARPSTPSANSAAARSTLTSVQQGFLKDAGEAARQAQKTTGVPASVTLAQAILESDWGRSKLARDGNNYFGIKAKNDAQGSAGVIRMPTREWDGEQFITVEAAFRAYKSMRDSFEDHSRFLLGPRYQSALAVKNNADEYARRIHQAGYATDPGYATKLINLMAKFDLYQFDR